MLAIKITGAGQRATLSAMLRDGLKAVTVRVNDVEGVGGFVLPGDRVDVALTRQLDKTNASTEVVLQNARVLAIDQIADERTEKPAVVKSVTLEVDVHWRAEAVAGRIGRQPVADAAQGRRGQQPNTRAASRSAISARRARRWRRRTKGKSDVTTVAVRRAAVREEYSVPIEGDGHCQRGQRRGPVAACAVR